MLWLLIRPATPSVVLGIAVGVSFIVAETLVVFLLNEITGETGFGVLYLLGVLVVSTMWRFGLAATISVASAIAFAYLRNWPETPVQPFDPRILLYIAVFLVVALGASTLAGLAREGERFFNLSSDLLAITGPDYVIRVNPAFERILGYSSKELQARPYLDLVVPEDRDRVLAALQKLPDSNAAVRLENRVICGDGSHRWIDWSVVLHQGRSYAVGRDVTDRRREQDELHQAQRMVEASRDRLGVLAELQAALRRVATLVARGASPSEVFAAVTAELARGLDVANAGLLRYEADGTGYVVAVQYEPEITQLPVTGEHISLAGDDVGAIVLRTGRAARIDNHENTTGPEAERIRAEGIGSIVGVPIVVDGRVWGAAIVGSRRPEPMPPDSEARIADFADLVATAIANAATRAELIASRARVVAAADDARRHLERDLHDGVQQRLVSLGLQARLAEASVPPHLDDLKSHLEGVVSGLTGVSADLQETSRGIHPAILSKGGLGPALKTVARRCTVPVTLDLAIDRRLPDSVEVGAYYIVAETLTNTAKHARASQATVCAQSKDDNLYLSIRDDGIGGADLGKGSGLIGLKDRVEALGGRMLLTSPVGSGTSLDVTIPLDSL
ncbi:PAS domain-containing protein [Nocardia sp. NBC_01730]|uniref:PAS domain-containing protein n=1 Tax=Nocardia sp. NBC_01730 TaxID=2975998 RepID=UPI002E15CB55|nr:PAS domain-containing protein [Nocardia sp. NBC_01730]